MAGFEPVGIAGTGIGFAAVVVSDVDSARLDDAYVSNFTAVGSDNGLDAFRPTPARFAPLYVDVRRNIPVVSGSGDGCGRN